METKTQTFCQSKYVDQRKENIYYNFSMEKIEFVSHLFRNLSDHHREGCTNGSDYLLFCRKISEFARGNVLLHICNISVSIAKTTYRLVIYVGLCLLHVNTQYLSFQLQFFSKTGLYV